MYANTNLQTAKDDKFDEFYTCRNDIITEVQHYEKLLKDKIIYMPCDNPNISQFWQYFLDNFERLQLKGIVSTYYKQGDQTVCSRYFSWIRSNKRQVISKELLRGNGDFQSEECTDILNSCNIVITNPPFSLFRKFVQWVISVKKDFLILGNMNNITYKDIFPYIQEQRIKIGVNSGSMKFTVPDGFKRNNVTVKDGISYANFGNICWYTTLQLDIEKPFISLTATYKDHETEYPFYDNFDAIDVNKVSKIPKDYDKPMGVPVTLLKFWNPKQFKILGNIGSYGVDGYSLSPAVYINGKKVFKRILIQKEGV